MSLGPKKSLRTREIDRSAKVTKRSSDPIKKARPSMEALLKRVERLQLANKRLRQASKTLIAEISTQKIKLVDLTEELAARTTQLRAANDELERPDPSEYIRMKASVLRYRQDRIELTAKICNLENELLSLQLRLSYSAMRTVKPTSFDDSSKVAK